MASTNLSEPISQTLFNNSFTDSPFNFNSFLSALVLFAIYLMWRYIDHLPKRIHEEAIKEFEHKLDIQLTEVRNKLDTELEMIKLIRSQVEPQKITTYMAVVDDFAESAAVALADQQNLSPEIRKKQIEDNTVNRHAKLTHFRG